MNYSKIKKNLPSKKFLFTIGAIALIVLIITGAVYLPPIIKTSNLFLTKNSIDTVSAEKLALIEKIQTQDSDSDGLPDWEEVLWKTDSNNPDTDSDEVTDGNEVKTGHDPIVKGPNDIFNSASTTEITIGGVRATTTQTQTERLAKDFFAKYLQLKNANGGTVSADDQAKLVQSILSQTPMATTSYKIYTIKNLSLISGQTTAQSISTYRDKIAKSFANAAKINTPRPKEGEQAILQKALTNLDSSGLVKLNPIIKEYQAIVKNLLAVPVPSEFINEHLDLINSISGVGESISTMKEKFDDPFIVLKVTTDYENYVKDMSNSIQSLGLKILKLYKQFGNTK